MSKTKQQNSTMNMERRGFFKRGLDKTTQTVVKGADAMAKRRSRHWIRPPFALEELDFLLACTRCGACTEACPHDVIFPLAARLGVQVMGTPAMDILNKGCHLCADWPCITVCEPQALKIPASDDDEKPHVPHMAEARIDTERCLPYSGPECGACNASCPVPGALTWDMTRPVINPENCSGCGMCREICIVEPKAITIHSL